MPSLLKNNSEAWDTPWDELVAKFAPTLSDMRRIENFRMEIESFKDWLDRNFSSLSTCEPGKVAEIIRTTFNFERINNIQISVINLALEELGLTSQSDEERVVVGVRSRGIFL